MLHAYKGIRPILGHDAFVAPGAQLIGKVTLGQEASVWFNAVVRGDSDRVVIGEGTNIQDNAVVHTDAGSPALVGKNVTVGHGCIIHGCEIGDDCLIGMGSTILSGAKIGPGSLVGAGSLITEGKEFPPGSVIMGRPAKVVRQVEERDREAIARGAANYRQNGRDYLREMPSV